MAHPRPWTVWIEGSGKDRECFGIRDANDESVVITDAGHYPPDIKTAELIVSAVNALEEK